MTRAFRFAAMVLLLAACDQNMSEQKKLPPYRASALFGAMGAAIPPDGTVARDPADAPVEKPSVISAGLVERGYDRFHVFCTPCHGELGDGHGMVVQRGFPQPPSFEEPRLRAAAADHFYDVITNGYGAMYSYAARIPPADRWAITAYIRALQLSQHAEIATLADQDKQALAKATAP